MIRLVPQKVRVWVDGVEVPADYIAVMGCTLRLESSPPTGSTVSVHGEGLRRVESPSAGRRKAQWKMRAYGPTRRAR